MSAEKYIKGRAKSLLSGNWPVAVFSVLEMLFLPVVPILILMLSYSMLGESDDAVDKLSGSPVTAVFFVVFHVAAVLALLLLSPIYTGFVRVFSGIAEGKKIDPGDIFYYFDDKMKYKNAVKFMTGVIVKAFGLLILCNLVGIGLVVVSQGDNGENIPVWLGIVFMVIGSLAAFLCIHYFAFSVMLFSYYGYDPVNAVSFGAKVAKGNTQKLINLTASFIGWILLTFFVVPFVYVYPYMTCSYFLSVKYIIEQYKEQFGDIADSYADQKFKIDLGMTNLPHKKKASGTITQVSPVEEIGRANSIAAEKKPDNTETVGVGGEVVGEKSGSEASVTKKPDGSGDGEPDSDDKIAGISSQIISADKTADTAADTNSDDDKTKDDGTVDKI